MVVVNFHSIHLLVIDMKKAVCLFVSLAMACCGAPVAQTESRERVLPEPLFTQTLPDLPEEVPPSKRIVLPVSECVVEGASPPQKTPPGVYMSQEMSVRAARVKIAYDEIRGLYKVDLSTMDRERRIYENELEDADDEIEFWREKSRRSWFEKNKGVIGITVGFVVGAATAIGIAAAIDQATE